MTTPEERLAKLETTLDRALPLLETVVRRLEEMERWRSFVGGIAFAAASFGGFIAWVYHEVKDYISHLPKG